LEIVEKCARLVVTVSAVAQQVGRELILAGFWRIALRYQYQGYHESLE
jgi:thiamine monophosphate synthase